MAQFYISSAEPESDVQRCRESLVGRFPITITGRTEGGEIKAFTGVVQSVQEQKQNPPGTRWLVTMQAD